MAILYIVALPQATEIDTDKGVRELPAGRYLGKSQCVDNCWRIVIIEGKNDPVGCFFPQHEREEKKVTLRRVGFWGVWKWRLFDKKSKTESAKKSAATKKK